MDGTTNDAAGDTAGDSRNRRGSGQARGGTRGGGGGAVYGLGLIGALVHYLQAADGFRSGVLGVLKAVVWPAFLTHDLLRFLGA
jgi:hypothetical protein